MIKLITSIKKLIISNKNNFICVQEFVPSDQLQKMEDMQTDLKELGLSEM